MADPYLTAPDLELGADREYLLQIADDDGDGIADAKVIDYAITTAMSFMNGWLALNPGIPISVVTPVLKLLGVKIAIYILASRPPRMVNKDVRLDFEAAIARLQAIVDGVYEIVPVSSGASINAVRVNKRPEDSVWWGRSFPR